MQKTKSGFKYHYYNNNNFYNCPFTFTDIFIFSYDFELLTFVFCFQPTELHLETLLTGHVSLWRTFSTYVYLRMSLFFSSLLKDSFAGCSNLGWQFFFPFSTFNVSAHYLLAFRVSNKKSADNYIWRSLVRDDFFLAAFKILPLLLSFDSLL